MLAYWIWLAERRGLGHRKKLELVKAFSSVQRLYEETEYGVWEISAKGQLSLQDKDLSSAHEILAKCDRLGIGVVTAGDASYPDRLKAIADPPVVLYYKGKLPDFDREAAVGVVGTRKASGYGLVSAEKLSGQITRHGGLVVSGMAAGIDAQASWGALHAGGSTVGVLGGGLDTVYPASNRELYAAVEQQGCLISEYPPGTRPDKWTFPQRNRIVSGLSVAVLVVEAPEQSGTMITAQAAKKQGRELFVVPGHIDSDFCAGSNALLRDGAHLAASGWDVLHAYASQFPDKLHKDPETPVREAGPAYREQVPPVPIPKPAVRPVPSGATSDEQRVLDALAQGERNYDEIIAITGLESQKALAVLTMLEIKGMVTTLPGRRAIRNS